MMVKVLVSTPRLNGILPNEFISPLKLPIVQNYDFLGLANSEGSVWAENRKIVARHFRHVGLGKQALDERIRTEVQCVLKHIKVSEPFL